MLLAPIYYLDKYKQSGRERGLNTNVDLFVNIKNTWF